MQTLHRLHTGDARDLGHLDDGSVQLVLTSPPYPMVGMWDDAFRGLSPEAADALDRDDGPAAFEAMHTELDRVWEECARLLSPGGLACVNVGDATRRIGTAFQLYPNHARILSGAMRVGLSPLPDVLWHKPNNSPTKFMGSGMLPGGAYVTYEHEYVLIFRKGGKRVFDSAAARAARARSAYFWEERNRWFSDLWQDLRGTTQAMGAGRDRSGAFPVELANRLINMYSVYEDRVLDPFAGTGTTALAAAAAGRHSESVELLDVLAPIWAERLDAAVELSQTRRTERLRAHSAFLEGRSRPCKHHNRPHDVPVVTAQEKVLELIEAVGLDVLDSGTRRVRYGV